MRPKAIMAPKSQLSEAPPYAVETAIKKLGANLRTARLRRNITLADVAAKLGVSRFVVADAEKGKATTGIAVYVGMLWAMNLLHHFDQIANPARDEEGLALSLFAERERARQRGGLSDDF
jgi:transcriptional regulator with XRE-family HTH domain